MNQGEKFLAVFEERGKSKALSRGERKRLTAATDKMLDAVQPQEGVARCKVHWEVIRNVSDAQFWERL